MVGFKKALFQGLAPDRGLYMPELIPKFDIAFFQDEMSYSELASSMLHPFVSEYISLSKLMEICNSAFNFEIPIIYLEKDIHVLELFHGPTMAFKDFAARFMARCMEYLLSEEITILVATSGDTGSAVANAFFSLDGINVVILYPSARVSSIQEQQLTTYGGNVIALEVDGSFDQCQQMVKEAFLDETISNQRTLSSANSINIARLLPQTVYYAWAWKQISNSSPIVFSVPSGNFGNLTGGIIAKHMGLPIKKFIASTNANDVFSKYLNTGIYSAKPSIQTISNAMDVGNPSNFQRIQNIYNENVSYIQNDIMSWSFQDDQIKDIIQKIKRKFNYLIDPHTAIGLSGAEKYKKEINLNTKLIALSTAHPAKFIEVIEPIIGKDVSVPIKLQKVMEKEKKSIIIPAQYSYLKEFLIQNQRN